eukprot:gene7777-8588_t
MMMGLWVLQVLSLLLIPALACTAASTQPRLRYFNARGAAELARILMRVGQMTFEDYRYAVSAKPEGGFEAEEFAEDKIAGEFRSNMDRLPVLELESGVKIGQSRAIERFVCHRCGLLGETPEEAALIDCITENVRDIKDKWSKIRTTGGFAPNAEKDRLTEAWFAGGELASWLEKLERSLPEPSPGQWFSVGSHLSYADVSIWHLLRDFFPANHKMDMKNAEKRANCGRLSKIADKVGERVDLQAYLGQRPQTAF